MPGRRIVTKPLKPLVTPRKLAQLIAGFASDKKARDIVVLDMRKVANFCDYFVLCTGNSDRHIHAIAKGIDQELENHRIFVRHKQGVHDGHWVILDLGDVVTHIFDPETRDFYGLDYLWQQAKKVKWTS